MNTLSNIIDIQTILSYEVAEMMERPHWKVLNMIEGKAGEIGITKVLTDNDFVVSDYFIESSYKDTSGKTNKCYECTKMGCELLANKLTGEKGILFTAKYVKRFNDMQQNLKYKIPSNYKDALLQIVRHIDENELLQIENKQQLEVIEKQVEAIQELLPKADYFDALVERRLLTNLRDTAKELGIKEKQFINWLIEKRFCYRDKKNKVKPYSNKMKYFHLKEFITDTGYCDVQTLINPEGRETFRLLLEKEKLN